MLSAAVLRQVSLRKCDTRCLRRQPGPRGHESSGNSLALPPIAQAMESGKWISQQPELQRWDQEPLIFCTAFCNSHAHREIMKRIIYPTLKISARPVHVIPSQACSVGHSQPWDWTQELGQTTTPHLLVSHPAWGLDTGRVFTLKGRGVTCMHKGFISFKGKHHCSRPVRIGIPTEHSHKKKKKYTN